MGNGNYNVNEPEAKKPAGAGFLAGSIIGTVIGATIAVLCAPKPGKEIRTKLTEKSQGVNSKVKNLQGKRKKGPNSEAEEAAEEVARAIEEAAEELEREEQASSTSSTRPDNI